MGAAEAGKIDRLGGMSGEVGPQIGGDAIEASREPVPPRPVRDDHPARMDRAAVRQPRRDMPVRRREPFDRHTVAHRQRERVFHPGQVVLPDIVGDFVKRVPRGKAVRRLEPGAKRQRGDAQGGPRQVFGRAQHLHPRIRHPRTFAPVGAGIHHGDVAHALEDQRGGGGDAAPPAPITSTSIIGRPSGPTTVAGQFVGDRPRQVRSSATRRARSWPASIVGASNLRRRAGWVRHRPPCCRAALGTSTPIGLRSRAVTPPQGRFTVSLGYLAGLRGRL